MSSIPATFALAVLLATGLATICAWAPRRVAVKLAALGLFALFLPLGYAALADLLSRPKPVSVVWWERAAPEATVLAGQIREDEGIYLWLALPGTAEPRSYQLPWNREQAQQLQDAMRTAEEQGTDVKVRQPFEPSLSADAPMFYPEPPAPLPEKGLPGSGPEIFRSAGLVEKFTIP